MTVNFNGKVSKPRNLIGGTPQGTLIGGLYYNITSEDCSELLSPKDRYKYFDDLSVLDLVLIGINQLFLPPSSHNTQQTLNNISEWTKINKMKLNEQKSSYIIFTKAKTQLTTRLTLNDKFLNHFKQ